jgi:RNA ligase
MKLCHLLDIDLLEDHITNKLVTVQRHPTLPLRILNYSHLAQHENKWGDGTIDYCRGLIVDDNDLVIARPFKKFHNFQTPGIPETLEENLPKTIPTITKKLDGSLGIYWYYNGQEGIATRGSFTSPQALWATKWYHEHMKIRHGHGYGMKVEWAIDTTPLFEIIYPENRIVVRYDFEGLVLLGMVDIGQGFEWDYNSVLDAAMFNNFRITERLNKPLEQLKEANIENEEGYVLTYFNRNAPPLKIKIKMADYVRLHKIVTGMNARSVWELLSTGKDFENLSEMPEPFQKWMNSWVDKLVTEYNQIFHQAYELYKQCPTVDTEVEPYRDYRKRFALWVQKEAPKQYHSLLFAMLDNQDPSPVIWKMIKPRGDDQTFRTESE